MEQDIHLRPPIGFIVEGHGEYEAYPSLVARVTGARLDIPIINNRGFGDFVKQLPTNLDQLVRLKHPHAVVVSLDLADTLDSSRFTSCADLLQALKTGIGTWLTDRAGLTLFEPMPSMISAVIQVRRFESWWLSDPVGLATCPEFLVDVADCAWTNVDEEVPNPGRWLRDRARESINLKSPRLAKSVITRLDPARMVAKSRSFAKFEREVKRTYQSWQVACGYGPS